MAHVDLELQIFDTKGAYNKEKTAKIHEIEDYQEKLRINSMIILIFDVLMFMCWYRILPLGQKTI